MLIRIITYIILFPLCMGFGYFFTKWIRGHDISSALKYTSDTYYRRIKDLEEYQKKYGNSDKINWLTDMDIKIEMSGLRRKMPFLTTEIYIAFVIGINLAVGILVSFFTKTFLLTVMAVAVTFFTCKLTLKLLVEKNIKNIDDGLVEFVNQLFSYSNASNDLVTIVNYALPFLNEPLYSTMQACVQEARMTGNIDLAFQRVNLKLKHRQLNMFLDNLVECSHNSANYKDVINRSYDTISVYVGNKEERKAKAKEGNVAIIAMLVVLFVSLLCILKAFLKTTAKEFFFGSFSGKVIFVTFMFTCLFSLWKCLNMGRER